MNKTKAKTNSSTTTLTPEEKRAKGFIDTFCRLQRELEWRKFLGRPDDQGKWQA